jgi:hypothetical protein
MFVMGKLGIRETSPSKAKHVMVSLKRTVIMAINTQQTDFTMLHVQKYAYEHEFHCIHTHIYMPIYVAYMCVFMYKYVCIYE